MHWILQNNLFNEAAYQTLLDTLERMELPYSIHKVVPFVGELVPPPDELTHWNVICMGSYSLRHAADAYKWEPGVFDLEQEDFLVQKQHWGDHMLNADSRVAAFKDVDFEQELMFLRPTQDSKVFAGRVFTKEEFYEWKRKVVVLEEDYGNSLTKDTLIQFCEPKVIYAEYRFWVVKGKIVTKSLYKRGNTVMYSSDVDERFDEYVKARIAEWQPHDAFCIDVCDTPDGIKIVEINTLNSCGFYAADIPKLVQALEDAFNDDSIPPDPGTKQYERIVAAGCLGRRDYWGEYDCDYSWTCEECPVFQSAQDPDEEPTLVEFTTGEEVKEHIIKLHQDGKLDVWSCNPADIPKWTPEAEARLKAALGEIFNWNNKNET